jgi:dephospho-CoA kinase|tara:strand:- start:212 stop:763 length:552 start_codon:yes stop_codon:yes gene_type:complete
MLIGLTGSKAGGKGEVSDILKEKGFLYESLSDRVREEAVKRGMENYTVKELQNIGDELRRKFGDGIWAKKTLEKVDVGKNYIIDGIRNLGEIEELKKSENFILIAVDAPQKVRFERILKRARISDPKDWETFLEMDERDIKSKEQSGQEVGKCMEMADVKIFNSGSLEELKDEIRKTLENLGV